MFLQTLRNFVFQIKKDNGGKDMGRQRKENDSRLMIVVFVLLAAHIPHRNIFSFGNDQRACHIKCVVPFLVAHARIIFYAVLRTKRSDDNRMFAVSYLDTADITPTARVLSFFISTGESEEYTDSSQRMPFPSPKR